MLNDMIGQGFRNAALEQLPDKITEKCSKKVKLLQFYTVFYGKDGKYLFEKDGVYYYPLTVVYTATVGKQGGYRGLLI